MDSGGYNLLQHQKRAFRPSDFFVVILPSISGAMQVFAPDFKIEFTVDLPSWGLPAWISHLLCEMEAEMNRVLSVTPLPHKRPRTLNRILVQSQGRRPASLLAKSLGVTPRAIQLYKKAGIKLKQDPGLLPEQEPASHLDYPIIFGPQDGVRKVFYHDFKVSRTVDQTIDLEDALKSALETLLGLGAKAFLKAEVKPKPSFLRPALAMHFQNLDWLTTSDLASELKVSPKTILRHYRSLAQLTPGGHLRWSRKTALEIEARAKDTQNKTAGKPLPSGKEELLE